MSPASTVLSGSLRHVIRWMEDVNDCRAGWQTTTRGSNAACENVWILLITRSLINNN